MSDITRWLIEFHETYDAYMNDEPTLDVPPDVIELRKNLIREEFIELVGDGEQSGALDGDGLGQIAKELADLLYVVIGTAIAFGINAEQAASRVHLSNMSKLDEDGKPILRESDGKVMKGPHYIEPDMDSFVANQGSLRASLNQRRRSYRF